MSRPAASLFCALVSLTATPAVTAQDTAAPGEAGQGPGAQAMGGYKESLGFLDALFVPAAELRVRDRSGLVSNYPGFIDSEGGNGRGLRVRVPAPRGVFLQAEFQINEYDGFDRGNTQPAEATLFRGGVGLKHPRWPAYGLVEVIHQEVEFGIIETFTSGGYGAHAGVQGGTRVTWFAQLGYVDAGDFGGGLEYAAGGAFRFNPVLALFADYRAGSQEDGELGDHTFADLRVGLRVNFVKGKKKGKPRQGKPPPAA